MKEAITRHWEKLAQPEQAQEPVADIDDYKGVIKAVAHIGIDWGYGVYELEQKHIDMARKLYEADESLQNPTLTPPAQPPKDG